MTTHAAGPHPDDGTLLRLLDGDDAAQERMDWRQHLAGCDTCRARAGRLELRSARLSRMLREVELPVDFVYPAPPVRTGRRRRALTNGASWPLHAATVALIILVPLLGVSPLRASVSEWIVERWVQVMELTRTRPPAPAPPATPGAEAPASVLWFEAIGPELRIELVSRQQADSLVLRPSAADEGSLRWTNAAESPEVLLSERGVRIRNGPAATASFDVHVPAAVRRVVVQVGAEAPIVVDAAAVERERVIPLGEAARRR